MAPMFEVLRREIEGAQSASADAAERADALRELYEAVASLRAQFDGGPGPVPGISAAIDDSREQVARLVAASRGNDVATARGELELLHGLVGTYLSDTLLEADAATLTADTPPPERAPSPVRSRKEGLHLAADKLGGDWNPSAVGSALDKLAGSGIELDPRVETPDTIAAIIRAANLEPSVLELTGDELAMIEPVEVRAESSSPHSVGEIAEQLNSGPVTLVGPEAHWCIQALANGNAGYVHVEILDPVHWESGPALPTHHLEIAESLGFVAGNGLWVVQLPLETEDLTAAAELMVSFIDKAWR